MEKQKCGISRNREIGVNNLDDIQKQNAFEITVSYINVVLFFDKEVMQSKNADATINATINATLNGTVKTIFEQIKQNNNVTINELIDLVGKSERTIKRNIAQLKEKGYIERVGSDKTGYWKIFR